MLACRYLPITYNHVVMLKVHYQKLSHLICLDYLQNNNCNSYWDTAIVNGDDGDSNDYYIDDDTNSNNNVHKNAEDEIDDDVGDCHDDDDDIVSEIFIFLFLYCPSRSNTDREQSKRVKCQWEVDYIDPGTQRNSSTRKNLKS